MEPRKTLAVNLKVQRLDHLPHKKKWSSQPPVHTHMHHMQHATCKYPSFFRGESSVSVRSPDACRMSSSVSWILISLFSMKGVSWHWFVCLNASRIWSRQRRKKETHLSTVMAALNPMIL